MDVPVCIAASELPEVWAKSVFSKSFKQHFTCLSSFHITEKIYKVIIKIKSYKIFS